MSNSRAVLVVGGLGFVALLGWGIFDLAVRRPAAERAAAASGKPSGPARVAADPEASLPVPPPDMEASREIGDLERILAADPENVGALVRLANLYHDRRMWGRAVEFYERAVARGPADADVLTDTGVCYEQLRQFDRALEFFRRAQQADPSHWQSLYNVVIVAGFHLGRLEDAEEALERLERLNPDAPNLAQMRSDLERVRAGRGQGGRS